MKTRTKGTKIVESRNNELTTAVEGIDEELGQFVGVITHQQKTLLNSLIRLYDSLRGPEDALDQSGYNRPIPPAVHNRKRQYSE